MVRACYRLQIFSDDYFYMEDNSVDNIKSVTVDGVPIRKLFIGNLAQRVSFHNPKMYQLKKKIIIRSLAHDYILSQFQTTHRDLERLFSSYGKIHSCYLKRNSGKSNYAFITFQNVDDALKYVKN